MGMGFVSPQRGIFESDASPGYRAWAVFIAGRRCVRLEVRAEDRDAALIFLWRFLCDHDQYLRLL